jgi:hypothetical protein
VGPIASLDTVSRRNIPSPLGDSNPDHPIVQPVVSRYNDWLLTVGHLHPGVSFNALMSGIAQSSYIVPHYAQIDVISRVENFSIQKPNLTLHPSLQLAYGVMGSSADMDTICN